MIRFNLLKKRNQINNNNIKKNIVGNIDQKSVQYKKEIDEFKLQISDLKNQYKTISTKYESLVDVLKESNFLLFEKVTITKNSIIQIDAAICFVQIRGAKDRHNNDGELLLAPLHTTSNCKLRCVIGIDESVETENLDESSSSKSYTKGQTYISLKDSVLLAASCGNYKNRSTQVHGNELMNGAYISFYIFRNYASKPAVISDYE